MKHEGITITFSWITSFIANMVAWMPTVDVLTKMAALALALVSTAYTAYKFYRRVQYDLRTIEKESEQSE